MASSEDEHAIDSAIAGLYRGPLEDFVSRRDALVKELRGSGERDSAAAVKALKKPSRTAWALDLAVLETPGVMTALAAVIGEAGAAQSSGADVRASISAVRAAVREFAAEAARVAAKAGHDVDAGALVPALFAVLGDGESFSELRRGTLTDVPAGGGLDLLGSLPALPDDAERRASPAPSRPGRAAAAESRPPAERRAAGPAEATSDGRRAAARAKAEKAAAALTSAKGRAAEALRAFREAEAGVSAAEERARKAEEEADRARTRRDRARQGAEEAAAAVEKAQAAVEEAEQQLTGR